MTSLGAILCKINAFLSNKAMFSRFNTKTKRFLTISFVFLYARYSAIICPI